MITNIEQLLKIYNVETEKELNWYWISIDQKLSEEFIEKYSDKVDWFFISIHQTLSEKFIIKHSDKVNWCCVIRNQKLSESFIEKYWEKIPILSVVKECGNKKRTIFRLKESPEIIYIGCFEGTKEEAIKAIKKKYKYKPVAMQQYIDKVEECFNITLID